LSRETLITTTKTRLLLHFRTATAVTNALHPVSGPWLSSYNDELALETLFLFMLQWACVVFLLWYIQVGCLALCVLSSYWS